MGLTTLPISSHWNGNSKRIWTRRRKIQTELTIGAACARSLLKQISGSGRADALDVARLLKLKVKEGQLRGCDGVLIRPLGFIGHHRHTERYTFARKKAIHYCPRDRTFHRSRCGGRTRTQPDRGTCSGLAFGMHAPKGRSWAGRESPWTPLGLPGYTHRAGPFERSPRS